MIYLNEMRRLYRDGWTAREIAEHFGYSEKYINQIIQNDRESFPYKNRRISKKIHDECVSMVLDEDCPQKAVARKYGIHVNTVSRWVNQELIKRMDEKKCLSRSG